MPDNWKDYKDWKDYKEWKELMESIRRTPEEESVYDDDDVTDLNELFKDYST